MVGVITPQHTNQGEGGRRGVLTLSMVGVITPQHTNQGEGEEEEYLHLVWLV